MLSAIHLDDEPCLQTEKVHDVKTDRLLPPKSKPAELLSAQARP
jgi:hypothetical protein